MIDFLCGHCRERMSSPDSMAGQAEMCPACRRPVRVPASPSNLAVVAEPTVIRVEARPAIPMAQPDELFCPHCGSQEVQTLEMAWAAGTGSDQTVLAMRCAPPVPQEDDSGWIALVGVVIAGVVVVAMLNIPAVSPWVAILVSGIVLVAFVVAAIVQHCQTVDFNGAPLRLRLARWRALWICLRCGRWFFPEDS